MAVEAKTVRFKKQMKAFEAHRAEPIHRVLPLRAEAVERVGDRKRDAFGGQALGRSILGEETTIRHVWYRDNEKVGEYNLPVKGKRWRTFSKKTIKKGEAGDWRVEALDKEGRLIGSVQFRMN